jgi:hypothetical protein
LKTLLFKITCLLVLCLSLTQCIQHHYKPVAPVVEPKVGASGAALQEFLSECLKDPGHDQRQLRLRIFEGRVTLEISYFNDANCQGSALRQEKFSGPFAPLESPDVYKLEGKSVGALDSYYRADISKYQVQISELKPSEVQAEKAELSATLARLSAVDLDADYWVDAKQVVLVNGDFHPQRYHQRYCQHHVDPTLRAGKVTALTITLRPPCDAAPFVFDCEGPICRYKTSDIITILGAKSYRYLDTTTQSQVEFKLIEL